MRKSFQVLFLYLIILRPAFPESVIAVSDAWINEAPPTVKVLAGYMTICNDSDKPVMLSGAKSTNFEKIEFHLTVMKDGVASMHRQDDITIPAHSNFSFSPGKYHLMLFNPVQAVKNGDSVPLDLLFSNGETLTVEAEVKRATLEEHHHHH